MRQLLDPREPVLGRVARRAGARVHLAAVGLASRLLWVELAGVLTVGTLSLVERDWFPDAS